jgi:hypothetical protein
VVVTAALTVEALPVALMVKAAADAVVAVEAMLLAVDGAGVPMISILAVAVGVTPEAALDPPPHAPRTNGSAVKTDRMVSRDTLTLCTPHSACGGISPTAT